MMTPDSDDGSGLAERPRRPGAAVWAAGMALGIAIGVALNNLAVGIVLGLAFGVGINAMRVDRGGDAEP